MRTLSALLLSGCLALYGCAGSRDERLGSQALRDAAPRDDAEPGGSEDAAVDMVDAMDTLDAGVEEEALEEDATPGEDASEDASGEAARLEAYVNAGSGDDANDGSSATPLKTLRRAFEIVGEQGLVWLQPSSFTPATEELMNEQVFTGRSVPRDTHVRATAAGVQLGFTLVFAAGGRLEGVTLDASSSGRVLVTGGDVALDQLVWIRSAANGENFGIELSGSGRVTLSPGDDAAHNYVGAAGAMYGFASVHEQSELRIEGGVIDGASGAGFGNLIDLADAAKLTLSNVTISNETNAWVSGGSAVWMGGAETTVSIEDSRIDLNDAGGAACVVQDDNYVGTPTVDAELTILGSVLTHCLGGALQLREGAPRVHIEGSELSESGRFGIEAGRIGFDGVKVAGQPSITLIDTEIYGNYQGGITLNAGGTLSIQRSDIHDNGTLNATRSGIWLDGVFPYDFHMRGARVADNLGFAGWAGVALMGDASSTFDLGTAASPGDNTLTGNVSTQVHVQVAAGVLVNAVGNLWTASTQGSETDGRYALGGALCGAADPCDQTGGDGTNFSFTGAGAGARLRVAD